MKTLTTTYPEINDQDNTKYVSEETLLDYCVIRFILLYISIAILCAIFYSIIIAIIMIGLLISPCIAIFIVLQCTKE